MAQISFTISNEYEKELFAFIVDECKCNILLTESVTEDFVFRKGDEISSDKYLIVTLPASYKFKTEKRRSNYSESEVYVIYPFDENNNFLPIIEYERDLFSKNMDNVCRLYLRSLGISPQFSGEIKQLFQKIKKWIKEHSLRKITIDGFEFYEVK